MNYEYDDVDDDKNIIFLILNSLFIILKNIAFNFVLKYSKIVII